MNYGSFTLTDYDSETDTDSMKLYCQRVSVSVNNSIHFNTRHLLLGLDVGLSLSVNTP